MHRGQPEPKTKGQCTDNNPPPFPPIHNESPSSSTLKHLAVRLEGRTVQALEDSPLSSSYRHASTSPVKSEA
jgi:hypothetical protein